MIKIIVTGGDGLLAYALRQLPAPDCHLHFLPRREFDISNQDQARKQLDALKPDAVINTAAYNLVDRCEQERDLSWSINATATGALAALCAERNIRLVHYGTDYVFDGKKKSPYSETDAPNPLNHYGAGKLAGNRPCSPPHPDISSCAPVGCSAGTQRKPKHLSIPS